MRRVLHRQPDGTVIRLFQRADLKPLGDAPQDHIRQDADAHPALDHGHDGKILPRCEPDVRPYLRLLQQIGDFGLSAVLQQQERQSVQGPDVDRLLLRERMPNRQNHLIFILLEQDGVEFWTRRQAQKAAVHTPFVDPLLYLVIIAEQQLIIDVRMIGLKRADDAREPVRRDT